MGREKREIIGRDLLEILQIRLERLMEIVFGHDGPDHSQNGRGFVVRYAIDRF